MIDWCAWCVADAGRLNAQAACCRARGLAMAPAERRQAVYVQMRAAEGLEAVEALQAEVRRFKARRIALAPREARQRAYHEEMIEALATGMDQLKKMTAEEYTRQKAAP